LIAPNRRQKVEMDADHPFGMGVAEARSDRGAPIAALRGETSVAERLVHQLGEAVGDLLNAEARLPRFERQAVAGERRRHDGEGVRGIAAKPRRVGEARDQLHELEDRAGPAVQQQQRARGWSFAGHMQKMQIDAAEGRLVLREAVEPRFLGAPIKDAAPVIDELLEIPDIRSVSPRLPRRLVGETRSPEPFAEIGDGLIGNFERERLRLCRHGDLVWLRSETSAYHAAMVDRLTWPAGRRILALHR
jgi:hypothetical protein